MFTQVPEPVFFFQLELHPPGRSQLILVDPVYTNITEDVSTFRVAVSNTALVHLPSSTSKANLTLQFPFHPSHFPSTIYLQRNQKYSAVLSTSKSQKNCGPICATFLLKRRNKFNSLKKKSKSVNRCVLKLILYFK